jgi:hypothetical protein
MMNKKLLKTVMGLLLSLGCLQGWWLVHLRLR